MPSIKLQRISVKDKPNMDDLVETWKADASVVVARKDNEHNTYFQFMIDMESNEKFLRDQAKTINKSEIIPNSGELEGHRQLFTQQERTKQRLFIQQERTKQRITTESTVGISMVRRMIGGFLWSPLNRSSSYRQKPCFGSNTGKENDVFSNTDLLHDFVNESSSDHSSTHTKISSFTSITEDLEDTISSSSNGDEYNIHSENQSNAINLEEKSEMVPVASSLLSRLNEYEAVYRSKVYVHIEKEEQQHDETQILEFPFQKKITEKIVFYDDDDEESEGGWSEAETEYAQDDSWYIDIELPPLFRSDAIKSSTLKQEEMCMHYLDDLSTHTSTTIFDDVTNRSFYSLIYMTKQMMPSSNNSTTRMNHYNSLDQNVISEEVHSSTNNPQSELEMILNETSDHERERENKQHQQQYSVEHDDNNDDQSETTMIGGITYRAKDIECAWNEVEYSDNIQDDNMSQVHDLSHNISLSYRGSHIEDKTFNASLRQYDRYADVYKRYQHLSDSDLGIYHHVTTKFEPIERLEI